MVDGNIILSVAKAMELLQALSRAEKPLTLAELTECSGYPKSTVFGLLTTMRAYDVITQTPEGKYALGLRLFEYGRQVERKWDISRVARPYMEHLSQRTGASVMLSICEGGSVITLDQVEARDKLRIVSDAGARLPIYCTSQGKVFLAHMPRAQAEKLLRRQSMTQFTPHTITDVSALLQEVDACRTNGFAIENGEYKIGLRSISAPGLHGGSHRALHRGRYRHVPQHPFRRVPQRSGAGLRHRRHDLRRSGAIAKPDTNIRHPLWHAPKGLFSFLYTSHAAAHTLVRLPSFPR